MQNTFSQSGNDSKWFLKKIIFQNRYVALETPPSFRAKTILNFHFDYLKPSLSDRQCKAMIGLGSEKRRSFKARLLASNDNSIHMARRRKPVVDTGVVVVVTIVVVEVVATVVVEVGGASVSTDGGGSVS